MQERTFLVFKPDSAGLEKLILNELLLLGGISIINKQYIATSTALIVRHYTDGGQDIDHYGKKYISHHDDIELTSQNIKKYGDLVISNLCEYMAEKILLTTIFEGENVVNKIRSKVGSTEPVSAPENTIRGKYGKDSYLLADAQGRNILNLVHCSDSPKEAEREIYLWHYSEFGGVVPSPKELIKMFFHFD
ncbi:MAG: nucleoside-diphosphate kinase [Candidatus Pacebacteria bacterium]|nr:nucleoside-diphosphate kinase [Candidatus Paceibacterota bacterium]